MSSLHYTGLPDFVASYESMSSRSDIEDAYLELVDDDEFYNGEGQYSPDDDYSEDDEEEVEEIEEKLVTL